MAWEKGKTWGGREGSVEEETSKFYLSKLPALSQWKKLNRSKATDPRREIYFC